jgi:hypothetical protein
MTPCPLRYARVGAVLVLIVARSAYKLGVSSRAWPTPGRVCRSGRV